MEIKYKGRRKRKIRRYRKISWKKAVIPILVGITIGSLTVSYLGYSDYKQCLLEKNALKEQLDKYRQQDMEVVNGREVFLPDIKLNNNIISGDRIDIRIRYDNAEDYTVLLDKKVRQCDSGTGIVLELTEEEILMISSAVADMGQYAGTSLYAAKYPENSKMAEGKVNYVPNKAVLLLLGREKTEGESRNALEERLMRNQ